MNGNKMKNNQPLITIIMAVYNAEQWLHKSIGSVLDQTYANWELLCMDDGSTDRSLTILQEYASRDKRIRVYSYEHTGIHAKLLNRGIKLSTGDFIYSLDSDDYVSSDLLMELINRLCATEADFIIPDMYRVDEEGNILSKHKGIEDEKGFILTGREAFTLSLDWSIHTFGLCRKSIAEDYLFDEDGFSVEVTSRCRLTKCKKVAFSNGIYYYLQNPKAITKRMGIRKFYYIEIDKKILQYLFNLDLPNDVIQGYYYDSIKRLIDTRILYYKSRLLISNSDKKIINTYYREVFPYYMKQHQLFNSISVRLSRKQYLILSLKSLFLFNLYCYLRSRK